MAQCSVKKRPLRRVCIGAMRELITLKRRDITAPIGSSIDFGMTFSQNITAWAMVRSIRGVSIDDGTNPLQSATHEFTIRKVDGLELDWFVDYKGRFFRILDINNLDEQDRFLVLLCAERGDNTKLVNYA